MQVPTPLGVTAVDWSEGKAHPREYQPLDITAELVSTKLRSTHDCPTTAEQHSALQSSAWATFVSMHDVLGPGRDDACASAIDRHASPPEGEKLGAGCSFLARKFGPETVDTVADLFADCGSGLAMVAECRAHMGAGGGATASRTDP